MKVDSLHPGAVLVVIQYNADFRGKLNAFLNVYMKQFSSYENVTHEHKVRTFCVCNVKILVTIVNREW